MGAVGAGPAAVAVAAVASFAPASLAQTVHWGGLGLETPSGCWFRCPPSRSGDMGNPRAAAWWPVTRAGPGPTTLLLLSPAEAQLAKRGLLFRTVREEGSRLSLYRVSIAEGNTSLSFSLSLFLLLRETPTHFASEAEKPQEAQSKPREVSAHNFLMKAFKAPVAAALLPERLV